MKKSLSALIIPYVLVYLLPLGSRPMVVPDEMCYAEMASEMIASGDWIVPRQMEFRYFEKPVLGHWLNAVSMMAFGENRFGFHFAGTVYAEPVVQVPTVTRYNWGTLSVDYLF